MPGRPERLGSRSVAGTQWHLKDEDGFSWCGRPEGSLGQSPTWEATADPDRCQKCLRYDPTPLPLWIRGAGNAWRVLGEVHGAPLEGDEVDGGPAMGDSLPKP